MLADDAAAAAVASKWAAAPAPPSEEVNDGAISIISRKKGGKDECVRLGEESMQALTNQESQKDVTPG